MTVPVPIAASLIGAGAAILIAFVGALFNLYSRLGRLEAQILASRERSDMQYAALLEQLAAAEERALPRHEAAMVEIRAVEERAIARHEAAMAEIRVVEERAIARHNELLAEIRLWRHHGHEADGNIFFRVPE